MKVNEAKESATEAVESAKKAVESGEATLESLKVLHSGIEVGPLRFYRICNSDSLRALVTKGQTALKVNMCMVMAPL